MGLSFKPRHLKRYRDLARLFIKYGRSDLVRNSGLEEPDGAIGPAPGGVPRGEELASDLESLGPTFIKFGQLLSTRGDLLPLPYIEALSRLQDSLEAIPGAEIEAIVQAELGIRVSKAFSEFNPVPVATASLGQVHRAALRNGRPVAVKIQRPGIRERIVLDLEALAEIAEFVDHHTETGRRYRFRQIVEQFRRMLFRELDYRQEARNLSTLAENLRDFDRIVVPLPVDDYTTGRVLTMDWIEGRKITALGPHARFEVDGSVLADQLFRAYLQQILVDGFLHADPHPGNVFVTPDGRIALLDLGMTVRLHPDLQQKLLRLLLAVSEGHADEASTAVLELAEKDEDFDKAELHRRITEFVSRREDPTLEETEVGRILLKAARASADVGVHFPPEVTLVGQTLLKLDHAGRVLDPHFKPNASIRENALETMRRRMMGGFSLGKVFKSVAEIKDFVANLPGRINSILDSLASNNLRIKVHTIDEGRVIEGMQKIANRITLGLVLAALIVGAALLTRVQTEFRILGYPGLAILFFLSAALGGLLLAFNILFRDYHRRRPKSEA